jgi:hypothetical protein
MASMNRKRPSRAFASPGRSASYTNDPTHFITTQPRTSGDRAHQWHPVSSLRHAHNRQSSTNITRTQRGHASSASFYRPWATHNKNTKTNGLFLSNTLDYQYTVGLISPNSVKVIVTTTSRRMQFHYKHRCGTHCCRTRRACLDCERETLSRTPVPRIPRSSTSSPIASINSPPSVWLYF